MATPSTYPTRRSPRLRSYDYSQAGAYFVTICTQDRIPRFGHIHEGVMFSSPIGQLVAATWVGLEERYGIGLDAFVVMPDHLHGVVVLDGRARPEPAPTGALADTKGVAVTGGLAGTKDVAVPEPLGLPLSEIVRRFKTYTANRARKLGQQDGQPGVAVWQRNYYERVIRNERELNAIREYIAKNPLQWHLNRYNPGR